MRGKVRVFIATTTGPVAIDYIEPGVGPQSLVTVDRRAESAPMSRDYHQFVVHVVRPRFGGGTWRMNLQGAVEEAQSSWQLAVFVAHALGARLARRDEECGAVAWLSGAVDTGLAVTGIQGVDAKLETSAPLFDEMARAGTPVTLVLPEANRADATGPMASHARFVSAAEEAASLVGAGPPAPARARRRPRAARLARYAVAAAGLALAAGLFGESELRRPADAPEAAATNAPEAAAASAPEAPASVPEAARAPDPLLPFVAEVRPARGETCAAVFMRGAATRLAPLTMDGDGNTTSRRSGESCGVALGVRRLAAGWTGELSVSVARGRLVDRLPGSAETVAVRGPVDGDTVLWSGHVPRLGTGGIAIDWRFAGGPEGAAAEASFTADGRHLVVP